MKYIRKLLLVSTSLVAIAALLLPATERGENLYNNDFVSCVSQDLSAEYTDLKEVKVSSRLWELFFGDGKEDSESRTLIVGGGVFGARVKQPHVTVTDPEDVGSLKPQDVLLAINGTEVSSVSDVRGILSSCRGEPLTLRCKRASAIFEVRTTPTLVGGEYKLGIQIRDGAAGIGTITYIDPETGAFGGLGHGICDADSAELIEISAGTVTDVILGGVHKGESGKPGELCGILTDRNIGSVYANTNCGVFGRLDTLPDLTTARTVEIGERTSVHVGRASIISTVKNGKTREYDIEIIDVDRDSSGTKSFKIKVTDPALLSITGGIVRGMSGSPIIQDGKLVGAVTHVMVANPTEGYGIFIENMLSASNARNELPAA